jgi:hypothetical protein
MGSKNAIAKDIVNALPKGERLVDLFAGGCAITDYALKNTDKFSWFLVNDLNGWSPQAYLKALAGGFNDEERWISRRDFFHLLPTDDYVKLCFSFGNNLKTYLYNPQLEPYKRALHHIIFWEDNEQMKELCPQVVDIMQEYCKGKDRKGRRLASGCAITDHVKQKNSVEYWKSNPLFRAIKVKWTPERRGMKSSDTIGSSLSLSSVELDSPKTLQSLESLERLQSLQSLESLERLERLERLRNPEYAHIEIANVSYSDYAYRDGDVVYCDPPYKDTGGYECKFDSGAFWEWVRTRNYPIYVSEYRAPEDFVSIWNAEKRALFHSENLTAPKTEHLFIHRKFANR